MNNKVKYLIEHIVAEQWSSLPSGMFYGGQRNGGNTNPEESEEWGKIESKETDYHNKLRDLEPIIKQSTQYNLFLRDVGNTNPDDQSSLFGMYENFLRYFGITRDEFQIDNDDRTAAKAVAEYFQYHPDRIK